MPNQRMAQRGIGLAPAISPYLGFPFFFPFFLVSLRLALRFGASSAVANIVALHPMKRFSYDGADPPAFPTPLSPRGSYGCLQLSNKLRFYVPARWRDRFPYS